MIDNVSVIVDKELFPAIRYISQNYFCRCTQNFYMTTERLIGLNLSFLGGCRCYPG